MPLSVVSFWRLLCFPVKVNCCSISLELEWESLLLFALDMVLYCFGSNVFSVQLITSLMQYFQGGTVYKWVPSN